MRLILALMLLVGVLAISLPAFAEEESWCDEWADTISGRNDAVPMNFRVELLKEFKTSAVPVLNIIPIIKEGRMQIGIAGLTPMGEMFTKEGSGEIITRLIF